MLNSLDQELLPLSDCVCLNCPHLVVTEFPITTRHGNHFLHLREPKIMIYTLPLGSTQCCTHHYNLRDSFLNSSWPWNTTLSQHFVVFLLQNTQAHCSIRLVHITHTLGRLEMVNNGKTHDCTFLNSAAVGTTGYLSVHLRNFWNWRTLVHLCVEDVKQGKAIRYPV